MLRTRYRLEGLRRQAALAVVRLTGHENWVWSLAWSPDGKQIVTASEDRTVRIWLAETGEVLSILHHRGEVFSAKFSPEGTRILTAGQDGTVRVWQGR